MKTRSIDYLPAATDLDRGSLFCHGRGAWSLAALVVVLVVVARADADTNQWTSSGPEGGPVQALIFDVDVADRVFAGTSSNGVFRSTDGCATWTAANTGMTGVRSLSQSNDGILFAIPFGSTEVFRSTDAGSNWSSSTSGLEDTAGVDVVVDSTDSDNVFVGTLFDGVFRSTDSGSTWAPVNTGLPNPLPVVQALEIDPAGSTLFVGLSGVGIYRSSDSGASWQASATGIGNRTIRDVVVDPLTPANMFATAGSTVYASDDAGVTWAPTATQPGFSTTLSLDPTNPATLFAIGSSQIFRSNNSGDSWETLDLDLPSVSTYDVAVDPNDSGTVCAGLSAGVLRSTDGGDNWSNASSGLLNFLASEILVDPGDPDRLWTIDGAGVFRSSDGGSTWQEANQGLDSLGLSGIALVPSLPSTLYTSSGSELFRSVDSAGQWSPRIVDPAPFGDFGPTITAIAVDPLNSDTVVVGNDSVFFTGFPVPPAILRSGDGGGTWSSLLTPVPPMGAVSFGMAPAEIWIDPADSGHMLALIGVTSSSGGPTTFQTVVLRTTDAGTLWDEVFTLGDTILPSVLAIDPFDPNNIYAGGLGVVGGDSELWKSANGGDSWEQVDLGAADCAASLAIDSANPSTLYLACTAVFVSHDQGDNWHPTTDSGFPSQGPFGTGALVATTPAVPGAHRQQPDVQLGLEDSVTLHAGTRWGVYSITIEAEIFSDGFESGTTEAWSDVVP